MNDIVRLMGADAVERAGGSMEKAAASMAESAEKMRRAASDLDYMHSRHQQFLNDWLERLHATLEQCMPNTGEPIGVHIMNEYPVNVHVASTEEEEPLVVVDRAEAETIPAPDIEGPID